MLLPVTEDRRALHRIPELDRELPKTTKYLEESLRRLTCEVFSPIPSSVCAFFDLGFDHALAFRADMDALPITEKTGADYRSAHDGCMHACGHDGHMAMLLELARRIQADVSGIRANILLIFQPGEETDGGAKDICQTGILETCKVKAVFGMHLWPGLPFGEVFSRKNELMSRSSVVDIEILGRSSHIAHPEAGADALEAGVSIYSRIQSMERSLDPAIHRLCKFGRMTSGTAENAISSHTQMLGSLRAFDDGVFFAMQEDIRRICDEVGEKTGCTVRLTMHGSYPPVVNAPELLAQIRACVPIQVSELEKPSMTTEDFSFYQKLVPGVFFFLGVGEAPALHTEQFDFDESVLTKGAAFFEAIAASELPYCVPFPAEAENSAS